MSVLPASYARIRSQSFTKASKIYFDSKEAVLSEAGDITIPLKEGIISESDFTGDIGDVLLGNVVGRENNDEIIIYKNVGIGVLDLMTARAIYIKAKEKKYRNKLGINKIKKFLLI